ncbi:minor tail protein [Mycobacterium phage 39HC]|uniref:minor tail protein n=1 Tax=Mycobacterium phage 39HC TaxID=1463809 RepID=UPI0003F20E4F|nr:minor tail protein [Mycobacterium phage 39HC]AHJ88325.1 minor tail subunit [Mycobacterium phage 39HC]AHJ88425.1 minor tail subunit [Mycobacterium phage 40BC]
MARGDDQHRVVTEDQVVSIHTARGVQLLQFDPDEYTSITWGRVGRDASRFDLTAPPDFDIDRLAEIETWRDWASVYDGDNGQLLWTGPVMTAKDNRGGLTVSAKDHAAYLSRTRAPITRRWDATPPARIAGELWTRMVEAQGINARPIVRPDPEGKTYDFQTVMDEQMLDRTFTELTDLGLRYAVVSGTPILGPVSREPVATLSEDDFEGDGITFVKDGSATYNDVLVRGADNLARARADYYGQNLQTIVNLDSMFGVSNVKGAAQDYVRETGRPRVRLELPPNTVLKATAPVSIEDLMPSARFVIEARGIRQLFELKAVDVERRQGAASVRVTMESVEPELELTDTKAGPTVTLGSGASAR